MNVKSGDVYLNTLCLAVYAPGRETKRLMEAVIKMYAEISKDDKNIVTPVNVFYIKLLKDILSGDIDLSNKSELAAVLLKFANEPAVKADRTLLPEITNLLTSTEPVSKRRIDTLWKNVRTHVIWARCNQKIRKLVGVSLKAASADEATKEIVVQELVDYFKSSTTDISDTSDFEEPGETPVDEIDFSDKTTVSIGFAANHKRRQGAMLRFGLQGLNRMFGPSRMIPYGMFHAIAARSHHYKSGILKDITRWICVYNQPPVTNGKVPVVLFISLENEIHENLVDWFRSAYANAFQKEPVGMTDEMIVDYVVKEFSKNGFRLVVIRRMGEDFGYREMVDYVDAYEANHNAKVVAIGIDYLTLMKRCPEDKNFNDAKQLQMLGERIHNWGTHRDTFTFTGLQLDTEAARLATSGCTNIVKRYGEAHLADCRGLKRELDGLWFQEIENNHLGVPYLTVAENKLRYVNGIPVEDKYCAYRFTKFGIMDDVLGKDESVKDIYAENMPNGADADVAMSASALF